jgi:hypothetical protein
MKRTNPATIEDARGMAISWIETGMLMLSLKKGYLIFPDNFTTTKIK